MKIQLSPLASDIFICVYVGISLFIRLKLEFETYISPIHSLIIGACFLTILWVLVKLKVLNPNWFGLFKTKKSNS